MNTSSAFVDTVTSPKEAWLYTPVEEVNARSDAATPAERSGAQVSLADVNRLAGQYDGPRLVFVNGFFAAELSRLDELPAGLVAGDRDDVAFVAAGDGVRCDIPVHVVHVAAPADGSPDGVIAHPHTIIELGRNSRAAVIETYCGLDGSTVTDASTAISIGEGAELDQCRVQVESSTALHIGDTRIEQGTGSRLRHCSITVGADIGRNAITVQLDAPDATTELTGANITGRRQRHDTTVTVDHAASHCNSNQRFVGVVDDHGRGSFSGAIIVRPGTVATDAHQSNRNLVLDPNAEADTRPWLNILADDVRCTHGATVGRLDDDALFYLRSRGIAVADARTMLIEAFIRDIVDAIEQPLLREHVTAVVDTIIAGTTARNPS
ncbi:MAG TPA: Fe-S cluster assembly protein SufD [Ilumatobacteraceae bacterium]|nr:Fe-S cluster assembly protein SufD [Ilumatobacteraceae bacterium]HRB01762.1 Fe-S cluster assembly protein SufD [Ilumatobacteraceae bacterium]